MRRASFLRGASRRLIAAFVLLLLLPAAAVVWLGIRLVIQDRQLEAEGLRKQPENAAECIVNELGKRLADAERAIASTEPPGDDAVRAGDDEVAVFSAGEELAAVRFAGVDLTLLWQSLE